MSVLSSGIDPRKSSRNTPVSGQDRRPDPVAVAESIRLLIDQDQTFEIRAVPSGRNRRFLGSDLDGAISYIESVNDDKGVYYTLNPLIPGLGRPAKNEDVIRRRWFMVDIDPIRADGHKDDMASEAEVDSAFQVANRVKSHLSGLGWPDPVVIESGNGIHLLYRIDLPNDPATRTLLQSVLKALAGRFDTPAAHVDKSVHNAGRIAKLPGTWVRKGQSTPERPHRLARLAPVPSPLETLPWNVLEAALAEPASPEVESNCPAPKIAPDNPWGIKADTDPKVKYVRNALEGECLKVLQGVAGTDRNIRLNEAAFLMGTLDHLGAIPSSEVLNALASAARGVKLEPDEIERTLPRVFRDGQAKPRQVEFRAEQQPSGNGKHSSGPIKAGKGGGPPGEPYDYDSLSDEELGLFHGGTVRAQPVKWCWRYRYAFGSAAMIASEGGLGKTQIALHGAAQVTTGGPWPDGSGNAPLGAVIILSAEDKAEDTLKPRLVAMGADMDRIRFLKARVTIKRPGQSPMVNPVSFQDLGYWQSIMRRVPDCRMLVVDPLPAYLGRGVNDHRNNEVRAVMEPFISTIIEPRECVLLCISHLSKSVDIKTPAHRILGSVAYSNLPRNVHVVFKDPNDPTRRILGQTKCNNAPDNLPSLAFKLEKKSLEIDGETIETAIPIFESEPIDIDIQKAMTQGVKPGPDPVKSETLARWIVDFLRDRPQPTPLGEIVEAAGDAGFLGKKKPDRNGVVGWSNFPAIYEAKKTIPKLTDPEGSDGPPHAGFSIEESQVETPSISFGKKRMASGRPRRYWALASHEGGDSGPGWGRYPVVTP